MVLNRVWNCVSVEIESKELAFDMIKTKALNEFKGDIALSFGLIGDNRHLEKIYNNPTQNPRVAISFSVPIFDWGEKKARVKAQEVARRSTGWNSMKTKSTLN